MRFVMSKDTEPLIADPVTEEALGLIKRSFADAVVASEIGGLHPWIQVTADSLRDVCTLLKADASVRMDCLHLISAVDWPKAGDAGEIEVVYHLCSYARKPSADYRKRDPLKAKNDPWIALKVRVPRDAPHVPSVMDIWTGADWHERETYDLVGVEFTGRQGLQRILLPEDWPGHPLLKDWEFPADYHGIPIISPEDL